MKSLAKKITLIFSALVVLSIFVVAIIFIMNASSILHQKAFLQLESVHAIKKEQIFNYFEERLGDLEVLSNSTNAKEAIVDLLKYYNKTGSDNSNGLDISSSNISAQRTYDDIYQDINSYFKKYAEVYGYNDILILSLDNGHVMYTMKNGYDFGANLSKGDFKFTQLTKLWEKVKKGNSYVITDMSEYLPSNNEPVMFIGSPVTINGEPLGIIVLRISHENINNIMNEKKGLGETGETFLVGDDLLMRSDSRFLDESTILKETVDSVSGRSLKEHSEGEELLTGYRGNTVLSIYSHLGFKEQLNTDFEWSIIAQINETEINKPVRDLTLIILSASFLVLLVAVLLALLFSKSLSKPLISMMKTANRITNGDFSKKIDYISSDEIGDLAGSLNSMSSQLEDLFSKHENQLWMAEGLSKMEEIIRENTEILDTVSLLCRFFAKYLEAQIITFYIHNNNKLELAGNYAFSKHNNLGNTIDIGEGIAGQAAIEKKVISVLHIPNDYTRINSSIGDALPTNIVAVPFIFADNIQGVMEIGSFIKISDKKVEFLERTIIPIGITINTANEQIKTKMLLEKTQRQTEELQTQQEELKVTHETLEEQAIILKKSEEELKHQSEELKVSNEELTEKQETLAKQFDELEWAKWGIEVKAKELDQVSKYKSEFLANMSHELRTPLNSMLLLSKSLANNKQKNLTEDQVEDAEVINRGGKDLLNLINDIMDLSKVEAGMLNINIEEVYIDTIVSILHRYFDPVAKSKNLSFEIKIDNNLSGSIKTDGKRLEQILKNFLSNALKFTEKGSIILNILQPESNIELKNNNLDSKSVIAFAVTDTGIGIPIDKQLTIFEVFQQQDGSTNRKYGGTGLGLSISKELASLLNGEIQLESRQNQGSTFTLYLPIDSEQKDADQVEIKPHNSFLTQDNENQIISKPVEISLPDISDPPFLDDDRNNIIKGTNSLLIIEDDKSFAKILRDHVRDNGYSCLVAREGRTGLYLAGEYQPVGIILDIGLPDIDGHKVLEQLKYNLKTKHIPVHFISSADRDQRELIPKGAIGYLTKPVSEEQLNDVFIKLNEFAEKNIKTLLVVEEDKSSQLIIRKILEDQKLTITYSGTGEDAINKMLSNKYDCIILDLVLPDMSGLDLLMHMNENKSKRNPPVIVYSGREINDEEHKILDKYSASVIIKGEGSDERLIDELSLFLHSTDESSNNDRRKKIRMIHNDDVMLKNRKILLADDNMRNNYALSRQLIETGLDVEMVKNGKEAIDILEKDESYELVLMDIMMPVMDGYEATKYIRKIPKYKDIPIIALTAKAMPEDREKCLKAGASEYLTKPIDFEKLLSILRIWLFKHAE
jgi:CheY-like chemotaxis protein/signal transduction histidine kinase/HAMP domain-containing protein